MIQPERGHIYRVQDPGSKTLHCMALTGDQGDGFFFAVRVTVTSAHHAFPYWVRMSSGDPCAGYVITNEPNWVAVEEIGIDLGALSAPTLNDVEKAMQRWLRF